MTEKSIVSHFFASVLDSEMKILWKSDESYPNITKFSCCDQEFVSSLWNNGNFTDISQELMKFNKTW